MPTATQPTGLNLQARALAKQIGVKVGTDLWISGGAPPQSHAGAEHPDYGHRHTVKDKAHADAILCNALERPMHYPGAPLRCLAYENAGRPDGSKETYHVDPETGLLISGRDQSHFHVEMLFALWRDPRAQDWTVDTLSGPISYLELAALLLLSLHLQLVGMWRKTGAYYTGERPQACMIRAYVRFRQAGVPMSASDVDVYLVALRSALDALERPRFEDPNFEKDATQVVVPPPSQLINPKRYQKIYNCAFWLLPALYDLLRHGLVSGAEAARVQAAVVHYSKLLARLAVIDPKGAAHGFVWPTEFCIEFQPDYAWLQPEHLCYDGNNWAHWRYRALEIAAKVLGQPWIREPNNAVKGAAKWIVDADGASVAAPVGSKGE